MGFVSSHKREDNSVMSFARSFEGTMFEELMKHVQTFSPEGDTRTSEVFQGVIGVLHSAMDELDLSGLPRRGAWGSVTAKNFPNALGGAFEQAIVKAAKKRGVG
jgi:hypothetical protein